MSVVADPLRDPLDLHLRGERHRVEFELRLIGRRHLAEALQADVVAPALQHREVEVDAEVLGEEREVLHRQLVLECLGGGGHHDGGTRLDGRHEVRQGLAGPGPGLDHQVPTGRDGLGDPLGHLDLAEARLGAGQARGDAGEGVARIDPGIDEPGIDGIDRVRRGRGRRRVRRRRSRATARR